jgi:hypothetical protein
MPYQPCPVLRQGADSGQARPGHGHFRPNSHSSMSDTCVTGEGGEHHDAQSAEYYRVELNGGF